jgi:hypothetical protein
VKYQGRAYGFVEMVRQIDFDLAMTGSVEINVGGGMACIAVATDTNPQKVFGEEEKHGA